MNFKIIIAVFIDVCVLFATDDVMPVYKANKNSIKVEYVMPEVENRPDTFFEKKATFNNNKKKNNRFTKVVTDSIVEPKKILPFAESTGKFSPQIRIRRIPQ